MRILFVMLILSLFSSCAENTSNNDNSVKTSPGSEDSLSGEVLEVATAKTAPPTDNKLVLLKGKFDNRVKKVSDNMADHALRIASYLFNSTEFRDSIAKLDFNYHNLCDGCDTNTVEGKPRITGQQVLASIFRKDTVTLDLLLKKVGKPPLAGKCFGLGNTCPDTDFITSFYKNINCDMGKELPFEYAYAVHLCHEFTHNVGYCHTYQEDDIAESIGWIAYHFINEWYKAGKRIP